MSQTKAQLVSNVVGVSTFNDVVNVGTAITMYNSTGIISATKYYGDASNTASNRWTVAANGSSAYTFTGIGFTETTSNPSLYLQRGKIYEFEITSGASHPFQIRTASGGSAYNAGVTNNTATSGVLKFEVPLSAPSSLYYQCTNHSAMGGSIYILNADSTQIVSGLSSISVSSSSTISAYHNGSNIFNVVGSGVTMVAGKRFDVSSYSENVNFLGSVSGTTYLDVGTYSVFVADISGTTSVTFQLQNTVSGRLSSGTLILRFSGTGTRNISLAMNPKYVAGSGPTYSTTAVTDIISFFTPDGAATTYISVVGQGFA